MNYEPDQFVCLNTEATERTYDKSDYGPELGRNWGLQVSDALNHRQDRLVPYVATPFERRIYGRKVRTVIGGLIEGSDSSRLGENHC